MKHIFITCGTGFFGRSIPPEWFVAENPYLAYGKMYSNN